LFDFDFKEEIIYASLIFFFSYSVNIRKKKKGRINENKGIKKERKKRK